MDWQLLDGVKRQSCRQVPRREEYARTFKAMTKAQSARYGGKGAAAGERKSRNTSYQEVRLSKQADKELFERRA